MAENALGTTIVCQVGIIVEDIAKTSKAWAELLGVEVPAAQLTDGQEVTHARYRGEGTDARAKLAFFNLGQVRWAHRAGGWPEHVARFRSSTARIHHIVSHQDG